MMLGCAGTGRPPLHAAPSLLSHTTPAMNTAGFWLNHYPNPDAVILSGSEIVRFNERIREEFHLIKDLSRPAVPLSGKELRARLMKGLDDLQGRKLVFLSGRRPPKEYWAAARHAINLDAIPAQVPHQYGLIVSYADQRFLPYEQGLYVKANDIDFDELQNSALDIGTPVIVLHHSGDGKWLLVESSTSVGWVRAENVGLATEGQVRPFWSVPFVVVIAPRADLYLNIEMTEFYGSVLMGVRLPLGQWHNHGMEVLVPQRLSNGTATLTPVFVSADQVREGYLLYTPREVLRQALKMVHQPYGWGGMYGAQDCSRFLQEVFATFGLELPRDSKDQIKIGETLAAWTDTTPATEKLHLLEEQGIGGITILGMKGHIMLYLGSMDGRPYAIHATWAYRTPGPKGDTTFVLNRVVVSDLSLGEGSKRGSLLERLNAVKIVR